MKLIVAGSTGFVATELIKQALSSPDVTSVIALARRETPVPQTLDDNADITKFKAVICDDFLNYLDNVKKELEGADACVWYCYLSFLYHLILGPFICPLADGLPKY
ncbi:putative nucleoside-diphosphate-sugar epimerase protein [Botrytis cinerea BcDW1]|uniref:Putative nucleoside-diphosphate-sugar epimerase protein n=1 Tax=Botryotinia fuckeliana (strain BcDW1) TaxID=1290391 RepID=M7UCE3_BOTF1|nr:putative nucleoside-diphosphate-sugar epimerase protein [Botrytis cinerea BcDW1]